MTWTNDDSVVHNLTSDDGWFTDNVAPGEEFTWQAEAPGTYQYHCQLQDKQHGTIVVVPGGAIASDYYDGNTIGQYFTDTCGGCHGANRQGGTGPALIPGRLTGEDDFYFDIIKNGRPGTIMPAWGDLGLSDEEAGGRR